MVERIGAGSLGLVCRAIDLKLKRSVVLKFLPPSLTAGLEARQRFLSEMSAYAALEHPNIGALHAVEVTGDGKLFLVMAYYEGSTLAARLERNSIPVDEAIAIEMQLLNGLAGANERGMVHGDVKPAKLIFNSLDVLKILDFGLAKLRSDLNLVSPGSTPGSLDYLSPECAAGAPASYRSDLWSAAVVLYEMITRRSLYPGTDPRADLAAILSPEPVPLFGLPPGLDKIVKRALDKDPDRRYQSAEEMTRDLEMVQSHRQLAASHEAETAAGLRAGDQDLDQVQMPPPAEPGSGRRLVFTAIAAALLVVAGFAAWFHFRQPTTPPEVPLALGRVRLLEERYPEAVNEFEQVLAIDPQSEDAYHGLAQAYAAMGLTDKAVESWRSDIAFHPNSFDPYNQLGKFELNRGNYAAAVANFRSALNLAPGNPAILSDLGAALSHAGSLEESRSALEQSIRVAPSYSAWNNLGDLELKQRHFPAAAEDYGKALEFNSSDYRLWTSLALAYARTPGQKDKARDAVVHAARLCRDALNTHPNDPAVLSDLAVILAAGPDGREEAQATIKRALALAPDDTHVQFNAAQTDALVGDRRAALAVARKLIASGYPAEDIDSSPILADLVRNRRE